MLSQAPRGARVRVRDLFLPRTALAALGLLVASAGAGKAEARPAGGVLLAAPRPPLEGKQPVAVGAITGGGRAGKVRQIIFKRLKDSNAYEVTDSEDVKPGSGKRAIARSAKRLNVTGVIVGRVSGNYDLSLAVYAADGKLIEEVIIKGKNTRDLENAVDNEFDVMVGPALATATGGRDISIVKPPTQVVEEDEDVEDLGAPKDDDEEEEEEEEEEAEEEEDTPAAGEEDEDEDDDSEPSKPGRRPFELTAGFRAYNRSFSYTDPQTFTDPADPRSQRVLLPYKLSLGPALVVAGRMYPAAFFRDDILSHIGVMGRFELGIATGTDYRTTNAAGQVFVRPLKTSSQEWQAGLVGRIPLAMFEFGLSALFGAQTFILVGDEGGSGLPPLIPDVRYEYIRLGLEARARFSKVIVGAHVAPRFLLSLSQIDLEGVWFPGATGSALDFGLMGGYALLPFLDVVGGIDVVRYGFDFNAIPATNPVIAGGATDQFLSFWVGATLHLNEKPE